MLSGEQSTDWESEKGKNMPEQPQGGWPLRAGQHSLYSPNHIDLPYPYHVDAGHNILAAGVARYCAVLLRKQKKPCALFNEWGQLMIAYDWPDAPAYTYPQAGDAVWLMNGWEGLVAGEIGIIKGLVGHPEAYYTWTFRLEGPPFYGSPDNLHPTPLIVTPRGWRTARDRPVTELTCTAETYTYTAWRWRTSQSVGTTVFHQVTVRLWTWTPKAI